MAQLRVNHIEPPVTDALERTHKLKPSFVGCLLLLCVAFSHVNPLVKTLDLFFFGVSGFKDVFFARINLTLNACDKHVTRGEVVSTL